MSFKYELHCHTGEVSTCATCSAEKTVELYKEARYDGIVITDHFSGLTFPPHNYFNIKKMAAHYLKGYKAALSAAGENFTVLLGMEIRFLLTKNDYIVYGATEDFVENSGNFLFDNLKDLYLKVKENGMLLVQAHPFRGYVNRANPEYLDGVEVFNGKFKTQEENEKSLLWGKEKKLRVFTSGSDHHHIRNIINGGILTDRRIKTNSDLIQILTSGEYELIKQEG